jgi:Tol biopolymer transport system component
MRHTLAATLVAVLAGSTLLLAQAPRSVEVELKAAQHKEEVEGDLQGAITLYRAVVDRAGRTNRNVAATALLRMADVYRRLGDTQARAAYERVTREFADQLESATAARRQLAALGMPPSSPAGPVAREVFNSNEFGGSSTPSQDGRYASFTDKSGNLSLRDLRTGADRLLTHTADWGPNGYASAPVVSPDSRHVAYVWYLHGENRAEVRVISTAAGQQTPRTALRTDVTDVPYKLAWMPDGTQLQALRTLPDRTSQIGTITIESASFRSIKSLEWRQPNMLSLSPDGRYLAYDVPATDAGSPRDIVVLATDGSQETTAVRNPANDSFPLWSPDGTGLLFLSDRTGRNGLWMQPMQNGRASGFPAALKADTGPISLLGLTSSGTLHYVEAPQARSNIYMVELDGLRAAKPPAPLTERVINANLGSTWSKDGEYLAYYSFLQVSADSRTGVVVVRATRTGEERTIPLPTRVSSRFQAGPKWFPDNRSVMVESADAEGAGFAFHRLAIDTGNTELLARLPSESSAYDLSRDGRTIFYVVYGTDGQQLMRFDIEQRQQSELLKVVFPRGGEMVSLAASPDGAQLAITRIGGVVEVMSANGGTSREVFRPATPDGATGSLRQALSWTPDGRFLLFSRGDSSLWKVPALGGEAQKVAVDARVKTPELHPDGTRLVFVGLPALAPGTEMRRSRVMALDHVLPKAAASR